MSIDRFDHKVDRKVETKPARLRRIEVITGVERRRTWSREEKRATSDGKAAGLVPREAADKCTAEVRARFKKAKLNDVALRFMGTPEYPEKLKDAQYPLRTFYYRGDWDLVSTPSVAVVGARQITEEGSARTRQLVKRLVKDDFTIVSGLAAGTDTVAHTTALEMGGRTIAVLGTAIDAIYPKQNAALQEELAKRFLVISHAPKNESSQSLATMASRPLIRWSMQEIRRIASRMARRRIQPTLIIAWSLWRRAHQAAAQRAHLKSKMQL